MFKTIVVTETTKDMQDKYKSTYLLSRDKSLVYGHIPCTGGDFEFYTRPLKFDSRNRTFRPGF